ncbi:arylesterase [Mangrovivirga sp. M17]|uniref:Arylesterase n=1 Tax=Mangrovivirga halotolerans TaxID=2993936 RepID=A0ABT3RQE0_9BACT|nr:arylesterase [Mangrovivirga halotolerans]MCX2744011.1 arylesterase [Mangrovivirga halotolerans]
MNKYFILIFCTFFLGCSGDNTSDQSSGDKVENTRDRSSETKKQNKATKVILFYGNSLTAGLGVDPEESFPSVTESILDSLGYNYEIVNAGVSGETTASGLSRLDWVIDNTDFDVFVLELGANDGLRGIPVEETYRNLTEIIKKVRKADPDVKILLTGMMVPPNMGPEYSSAFLEVFPKVAEEQNVEFMPFLLKDVAGIDSLNQDDGIHPNVKGHKITARNISKVLTEQVL